MLALLVEKDGEMFLVLTGNAGAARRAIEAARDSLEAEHGEKWELSDLEALLRSKGFATMKASR